MLNFHPGESHALAPVPGREPPSVPSHVTVAVFFFRVCIITFHVYMLHVLICLVSVSPNSRQDHAGGDFVGFGHCFTLAPELCLKHREVNKNLL